MTVMTCATFNASRLLISIDIVVYWHVVVVVGRNFRSVLVFVRRVGVVVEMVFKAAGMDKGGGG